MHFRGGETGVSSPVPLVARQPQARPRLCLGRSLLYIGKHPHHGEAYRRRTMYSNTRGLLDQTVGEPGDGFSEDFQDNLDHFPRISSLSR